MLERLLTYLYQHVRRDDDSELTVQRKKFMLLTHLTVALVSFFAMLYTASNSDRTLNTSTFYGWYAMPALATSLVGIPYLLLTKTATEHFIMLSMAGLSVSFLYLDLVASVARPSLRSWSYFIIIIDICLLLRVRPSYSKAFVRAVCLWLIVISLEDGFRFGFYDLPLFGDDSHKTAAFSCDNPPCARGGKAVITVMGQIVVFLLDYYMTSGFATGYYNEHMKMLSVIKAAEEVATALSVFDLESADAAISKSNMSGPLHAAFTDILENLHVYKPYLPQGCLYGEVDSDEDETMLGGNRASVARSGSSLSSPVGIEKKNITFSVVNMSGSKQLVSTDKSSYQQTYSTYMSTVLEALLPCSGVVSVVVGDHVHCTFNATKRCHSHCLKAVTACAAIEQMSVAKGFKASMGIASGAAYYGSLGCPELLTYTYISSFSTLAAKIEEFCCSRGFKVVTSGVVYNDATFSFPFRIIPKRVLFSADSLQPTKPELLYELLLSSNDMSRATSNMEWMYELNDEWQDYNEAGRHCLLGNFDKAQAISQRSEAKKVPEINGLLQLATAAEEIIL